MIIYISFKCNNPKSSLNHDKDQPVLENIIKHMTSTTVLQ